MNSQTKQEPAQAEMTLTRHCRLVTCGQNVKRGERIATSSTPDKGDIHAPHPGKVTHVDPYRIRITKEKGEAIEPVSLTGVCGNELQNRLKELGADLPLYETVENLIINAVDAEQGVITRQTLLNDCRETLEAGTKALAEAYHATSTTMALLRGGAHGLSRMNVTPISDQYPSGLDPLVAKEVTGREAPENTIVIGLETVFHIGRIMETRFPVMETMITVGKEGKIVSLGTPVGEILATTGQIIHDRDRIILGGPMRGTAAASSSQGVNRSTTAVAVVSNPAPIAMDAACVGCGECVRRCPARLDPAMITSYAEFGMYDKAAEEHVDACFECGLCGFFCIARRPMLQYIRLTKNELAQTEAQSGKEK